MSPCFAYLRQGGTVPPACCGGMRDLNGIAQTTPDRQQACKCVQSIVSTIFGLNPNLAAGLPGLCGVSFPYPISVSNNCDRVKGSWNSYIIMKMNMTFVFIGGSTYELSPLLRIFFSSPPFSMDPDEHVSYNTSNNAADKDPAQSESGDFLYKSQGKAQKKTPSLLIPFAHVEASLAGADFGAGSDKVEDHNKTPISSSPVTR
ncbi:hypothetical protein Bca52824_004595 [Brassica carinata]|uniref:Non-specific lipid-transfer protein n=1 Tax=Brassica carinata TaxID=52824 RepID=A0A8X8BFU3_BRACI|nr:hypothetical protein Bca52824_004595 [Brassica carinata]